MPVIGISRTTFLDLLKIKPDEFRGFALLLLHAFFSGLGIALAFTAISSLIIDFHAVHHLPTLYVVTAFLLLISGFLYSRAEHAFHPAAVFKTVLIIIALWAVFMFLNMSFFHSFTLVIIAFCTYYLIYYLSNLEYWGTASLMFNVRQGKRLFGLLSVGESLAKISGYAITPLIITELNISWVFVVITVCFLSSLSLFWLISRQYSDVFQMDHSHHHPAQKHGGNMLSRIKLMNILKLDDFRKFISLFALLSTLSYFLFHYGFLLEVEEEFTNLEEVAIFFASLFSAAKFLNLLIKIFLAGRLLQYLGLKYILLLLPVTMLLVIGTGVALVHLGQFDKKVFIWIFTIVILLDEILRSSLYTPSYLILFQPLSKSKRLEGHTLSKGIMEPIGIGLAGVIILIMFQIDKFNLELLAIISLFVLILWIFAGTRVFSAYIKILQEALKTKILSRGSFNLSKDELQVLKEEKLCSNDPREKYYALQLLGSQLSNEEIKSHILDLLSLKNDYIIQSTLKLCNEYEITGIEAHILPHIHSSSEAVAKTASYEFARQSKETALPAFKKIFNDAPPYLKNAIVGASIRYGGLAGAIEFGRYLLEHLESNSADEKVTGAAIIGAIGIKEYYSPLINLFDDSRIEVKEAAVYAAGQVGNPNLIPFIIKAGKEKSLVKACKESLSNFGPRATKEIKAYLGRESIKHDLNGLKLLETHKANATTLFYIEMLNHPNFNIRDEVIKILFKRAFWAKKDKGQQIKSAQSKLLTNIDMLLKYLKNTSSLTLEKLIYDELYFIQLSALYKTLSFTYPRKAINEIIANSYIKEGEFRTNALELLENTLHPREIRSIIKPIEQIFEYKLSSTNVELSDDDSLIIKEIITDANRNYSAWIVANCIRLNRIEKLKITIPQALINNDITIIAQELNLTLNMDIKT